MNNNYDNFLDALFNNGDNVVELFNKECNKYWKNISLIKKFNERKCICDEDNISSDNDDKCYYGDNPDNVLCKCTYPIITNSPKYITDDEIKAVIRFAKGQGIELKNLDDFDLDKDKSKEHLFNAELKNSEFNIFLINLYKISKSQLNKMKNDFIDIKIKLNSFHANMASIMYYGYYGYSS